MAAAPLNTFKSVVGDLTTSQEVLYTVPAQTTAIVLLAQVANVGDETSNVTFLTSNSNTELVKDFSIPVGDAASLLEGKLVVETGESISAYASTNNDLKITVSILETR